MAATVDKSRNTALMAELSAADVSQLLYQKCTDISEKKSIYIYIIIYIYVYYGFLTHRIVLI